MAAYNKYEFGEIVEVNTIQGNKRAQIININQT